MLATPQRNGGSGAGLNLGAVRGQSGAYVGGLVICGRPKLDRKKIIFSARIGFDAHFGVPSVCLLKRKKEA